VLERQPAHFTATLGMAELELARDQLDEAIPWYHAALQIQPDDDAIRATLMHVLRRAGVAADIPGLIERAEAAYAQGRAREALAHFHQALAAAPENGDLQAATARCLRQLGEYAAAEAQLRGVLAHDPGQFAATLGMAELEMARGHAGAAIPWFRAAQDIQPGNALIARALIQAMVQAGDGAGAEALLGEALADNPQDRVLLSTHIDLLIGRGDLTGALAASAIARAHPEASGWCHLRHGELLAHLGRTGEALEVLQAIDANDDLPLAAQVLRARGVLLRELGRLPESLEHLRQAVEREPSCPDYAVALASLLAELGAFQEGLELLQEAERRVGAVRGLASQPWLRLARVILYRGSGDREPALAIADGLALDPQVGFHARVQRAELLMGCADPRAADAIDSLQPLGADQLRQERLSRSEWLRSLYRFKEALEPLEPLLASEPLDLLAAERACLLHVLVMDLKAAQNLFQRLRTAKQMSGNPRLAETAFHGLHRCLMEEFNTDLPSTARIRALAAEAPDRRLAPLAGLLRQEPQCSAAAIALLIAARQAGRLDDWASPPPADPQTPPIPHDIVQFWDAKPLPDGIRSLMLSWPETNPSCRHHVADRAAAQAFLERHATPLVRRAFAAALSPVLQSDLFRLAWLVERGGIYADADDRCQFSLEPLFAGGVSLVLMQEDIGSIGNNLIAATPRHPFLAEVLELAARRVLQHQGSNPWFLSGPGLFTQVFARRWAAVLSDPATPRPPGLRLLTQHELSRRVSMHLQTPVKVSEGSWAAPRGPRAGAKRLITPRAQLN
jgi:tetratricopeptide (TPR) repeat protein